MKIGEWMRFIGAWTLDEVNDFYYIYYWHDYFRYEEEDIYNRWIYGV
jgi:hypothetical protein